jgi:hypothetical protein
MKANCNAGLLAGHVLSVRRDAHWRLRLMRRRRSSALARISAIAFRGVTFFIWAL